MSLPSAHPNTSQQAQQMHEAQQQAGSSTITTKMVEVLLTILNQIKLNHWVTDKYGHHLATSALYDKLSANIDKIVEVYLGIYPFHKQSKMTLTLHMNRQTLPNLESSYATLLTLQSTSKHPELTNILEEVLADVRQAIYLCRMN